MAVDLTGRTASHQTEAVIVSTARTPIGKAYRGALNATPGAALGAHAVAAAVERNELDPNRDRRRGHGRLARRGHHRHEHLPRQVVLRAGLPVETAGVTINRSSSQDLQTIAIAAARLIVDGATAVVAGGLESISLAENEHLNRYMVEDPWLVERKPEIYMSMIETAEVVSKRYDVPRDAQDAFALESQRRTAAAQAAGRFDDEIVPQRSRPTSWSSTAKRVPPTTSASRSNATNATAPTPPRRLSLASAPSSRAAA